MLAPSPFDTYPPNWKIFDKYAMVADPKYFGLFSSTGDINRFAARYRVAKCYRGMILSPITKPTSDGYSAMCRVLLAWSAFEFFMKSINVKQINLEEILKKYDTNSWINEIRKTDEDKKLFSFIYERVNNTHQKQLSNYFDSDPCNITYLASAIRHLFAHGALTPNANGANPESIVIICNILFNSLMEVIDKEFSERMLEFESMINTS